MLTFGSSPDPAPDRWEPPAGGAAAEPTVPVLIAIFGLRACWYESFPFDRHLPRIEPGRIVLPPEEPGVEPWSGEGAVELPIRHDGLTLGRYVLVPASPTTGVSMSPTIRAQAISMADAAGARIAAELVGARDDNPVGRPAPEAGPGRPTPTRPRGRRAPRGADHEV